jgi:NADPH:quinone reductase-like Zn-dependent oxidoreductase
METMKAVRMHRYGGPEVLRYEDLPRPAPGPGEVLVRVHAAGVNPVDWKLREGWLKDRIALRLPMVPGWDVSGTVEQVGPRVTDLSPGDEVFGKPDIVRDGAYAEWMVARAAVLARKPARLDHLHAAAVPIAGLTAWQALFEGDAGAPSIGLQPGQRLLVLGGAGGVGGLAVQLARWRGAQVIATAGPQNLDYLRGLGAEPVDYTRQRLEEAARDVDAVLDLVGGEWLTRSLEVVRPDGVVASAVGPPIEAERRGLRAVAVMAQANRAHLESLARLLDQGSLAVELAATFPLAEAARAQSLSQEGHVRGKLALSIVPGPLQKNPSGHHEDRV